ncbi:GNAT family N-acetyltransferase [Oceanobacillus sp. 1P07AA]
MGIVIRPMKRKDITNVQDIAKTSWHDTYNGIIPEKIQNRFLEGAYSEKNMKYRLKRSYIYIAEKEGEAVGFANFSPMSEEGYVELGALYLYPSQQGIGIGSALLHYGIDQLHPQEIQLNVEKNNIKALNFYKSKGFEIIKDFHENFDGHLLNTYRMSWKLD